MKWWWCDYCSETERCVVWKWKVNEWWKEEWRESGWDEQNTKKARRKMCAVVVKKRRNVNLNHPPQFMWVGYSVNSANKPYHMNIGLFLGDTLSCEVNFFNSSTTRLSPAGGLLLSLLLCVCPAATTLTHTPHTFFFFHNNSPLPHSCCVGLMSVSDFPQLSTDYCDTVYVEKLFSKLPTTHHSSLPPLHL